MSNIDTKTGSQSSSDEDAREYAGSVMTTAEEEGRWYVLRTKPRQESLCLGELKRAGIEGLCPLRIEYRFRRRRREAVPMFPGYVFCRLRLPEGFHAVRWLRGVLHFVQFGEALPPALDDDVMRFFVQHMNEEGVVETEPDLVSGDRVEFLTESMKGLVGTVLSIDSAEQRVRILMDLLYQATIEVESNQVQAI